MVNGSVASHTESSGIGQNQCPEAVFRHRQAEQTMAHSGDSFPAWEKTKAERDELLDRLARTEAELENNRKRLNKQQDEIQGVVSGGCDQVAAAHSRPV